MAVVAAGIVEVVTRPELIISIVAIVGTAAVSLWVTGRRQKKLTESMAPAAMASSFKPEKLARKEPDVPRVTFRDVAGLDNAIAELREVAEYLTDPVRFRALGAEMPRGILLHGQPGCGKTLLARALAGETGVPFYSVSASSFVEQYVGLGAARVRQLFDEAKANAPAIVFIDELDAVGRQRSDDAAGGREFDNTLNQLLIELDGFNGASGVLILGATNRPELIDPALLRPGRFDRRVEIDRPDRDGREAILRLHASRRPFSHRVDWGEIAAATAGLSPAELGNIVNEASLLAARRHRPKIAPEDLSEAVSRVLDGMRSSRLMGHEEKQIVAIHEAGHALLSLILKGMKPPSRISIVGRGGAFDRSIWASSDDREILTKRELMTQLILLLGGRAAELNAFGEPSTRAEDDLHHAAELARRMVEKWAMTGKFELAGRSSESVANHLEGGQEVRDLLARSEQAARIILGERTHAIQEIAQALLQRESLTSYELEQVAAPWVSSHRPATPPVAPVRRLAAI